MCSAVKVSSRWRKGQQNPPGAGRRSRATSQRQSLGGLPVPGAPDAKEDLTKRYEGFLRPLLSHARPAGNPGVSHENGSIESAHGHLKRALADALLLRASRDFDDLTAWRGFVDDVVGRGNLRNAKRIDQERMALNKLPVRKTADYEEVNVDVTSSSAFTLRKVFYSVPSRLIGHRLRVRLYDDRLECFHASTPIVVLRRGWPRPNGNMAMSLTTVTSSIPRAASPWRCSIWSIAINSSPAEPSPWRSTPCSPVSVRDQLAAPWSGILALAFERSCEAELALALQVALDDWRPSRSLAALIERFRPKGPRIARRRRQGRYSSPSTIRSRQALEKRHEDDRQDRRRPHRPAAWRVATARHQADLGRLWRRPPTRKAGPPPDSRRPSPNRRWWSGSAVASNGIWTKRDCRRERPSTRSTSPQCR